MKSYEPLRILMDRYALYARAKEKSIASYQSENISKELHGIHMKNLDVLLKDYEKAIEILTKYNSI